MDSTLLYSLQILYYSSFFFIPFFLAILFYDIFLNYKRAIWHGKQDYRLLEIKIPREIFKSPKAMEFFINGLFKGDDEDTWVHTKIYGQTRPDSSLEIVSIGGQIHFYVRVRKWLKPVVEGTLYSQYPGIEISDVPDYTLSVSYDDPNTVGLWGTEFALRKEDVFPIKTYIDYGMDKDPKEEYKIDPLTPFIEYIGSFGRGHQMWLQIMIRTHKAEDKDPVTGKKVDLKWQKDAEKQIKKILENAKGEKGEDGRYGSSRFLTQAEQETISALERSISKNGFDVGMRFIYTAPKDIFVTSNLTGAVGSIMNFNANNLNGFKTANATGSKYIYPWQKKFSKKKVIQEKREMLDAYKRRCFFYAPYKRKYFVLNTEELATIFHFPGIVSTTPTYERIESRKAEAPANLPV